MATIRYNGDIVNSTVMEIDHIKSQFPSLASSIKQATNQIVAARGFQEYIGGIQSNTFAEYVNQCEEAVGVLIQFIRQKQIAILEYSADQKEINAFLDTLTRSDYNTLDLTPIASYISEDRKAANFFKGAGASAAAFGLGLVEGVGEVVETGADLVVLAGTGAATIFTGIWDLFTGDNTTERMWNETKAYVSEKHVENAFDKFYDQTNIGKKIKKNAYAFDTFREVGSGIGYTAGVVAVTAATCGLAGTAIGAGSLATTAGALGFSRGTENAWADGANIAKGLKYGVATGAWEAAQFYAGAKINQIGGLGDKISTGIFKGASQGVGVRIGLDAATGGLEGIAQPALSLIYKDYGGKTFGENFSRAFKSAGGWGNVATQATIGAIGSGFGEFTGARKFLKESAKQQKNFEINAKDVEASVAAAALLFQGQEKALLQGDALKYNRDFSFKDLTNFTPAELDESLSQSAKKLFSSFNIPDEIKAKYDASKPIDQQIILNFMEQMNGINSDKYKKAANEFFVSSLMESYAKGNTDALLMMHKIAENGGISLHEHYKSVANGESIFLTAGDINSQRASVARHELGHYNFRKFLGEKVPEQAEALRLQASTNIKNNTDALEIFSSNYQKARDNSTQEALKHLKSQLAEQGLDTDQYMKKLEQKYTSLSPSAIEKEFIDLGYTLDQLKAAGYDVSDPAVLARREANLVVNEMADTIFRSKYNEYEAVGDIIESIDFGKGKSFDYAHGAAYYAGARGAEFLAFHEQMANYTDLKLEGNTKGISMLRNIIGDDYVDLLEDTYQRVLKSEPNPKAVSNGVQLRTATASASLASGVETAEHLFNSTATSQSKDVIYLGTTKDTTLALPGELADGTPIGKDPYKIQRTAAKKENLQLLKSKVGEATLEQYHKPWTEYLSERSQLELLADSAIKSGEYTSNSEVKGLVDEIVRENVAEYLGGDNAAMRKQISQHIMDKNLVEDTIKQMSETSGISSNSAQNILENKLTSYFINNSDSITREEIVKNIQHSVDHRGMNMDYEHFITYNQNAGQNGGYHKLGAIELCGNNSHTYTTKYIGYEARPYKTTLVNPKSGIEIVDIETLQPITKNLFPDGLTHQQIIDLTSYIAQNPETIVPNSRGGFRMRRTMLFDNKKYKFEVVTNEGRDFVKTVLILGEKTKQLRFEGR